MGDRRLSFQATPSSVWFCHLIHEWSETIQPAHLMPHFLLVQWVNKNFHSPYNFCEFEIRCTIKYMHSSGIARQLLPKMGSVNISDYSLPHISLSSILSLSLPFPPHVSCCQGRPCNFYAGYLTNDYMNSDLFPGFPPTSAGIIDLNHHT